MIIKLTNYVDTCLEFHEFELVKTLFEEMSYVILQENEEAIQAKLVLGYSKLLGELKPTTKDKEFPLKNFRFFKVLTKEEVLEQMRIKK